MSIPDIPARYEPTGQILSGGQGQVHVCVDQNLGRRVAIKFLHDVEELDRLYEEIVPLQSLRSSHVVELYDLIPTASVKEIGLVEEFIEGDDLYASANNPFALEKTDASLFIRTIYQIARGISDIHSAGIIHRDIKLNNMKCDAEGLIKIFDFGLAKIVGPDAKTKGFKGTMGYAGPELYASAADTVVINQSVDVYAFGASAWLLACGDLPDELKHMPPNPLAVSLAVVRPDIPVVISTTIDQCLHFDPDERPAIDDVVGVLASQITFGRHRGILTAPSNVYEITEVGKGVKIDLGIKGSAEIFYDGMNFHISPLAGTIVVNNILVGAKSELPGASVIAFGDPLEPARRIFLTFDISHPEVVV